MDEIDMNLTEVGGIIAGLNSEIQAIEDEIAALLDLYDELVLAGL
jgi:hypothetical protein